MNRTDTQRANAALRTRTGRYEQHPTRGAGRRRRARGLGSPFVLRRVRELQPAPGCLASFDLPDTGTR